MVPRRSQQRRRDEKRAARERHVSLKDQTGSYVPPPREHCEQKEIPVQGYAPDRFHYRCITWRQAGRLVDFQITVWRRGDSPDLELLLEVDCQHGHVHYHAWTNGKRGDGIHLHRLDEVADLKDGLGHTLGYIDMLVLQIDAARDEGGGS